MSAEDLLAHARAADIRLAVDGDRLLIDAPRGTWTPELRDAFARHKPALLAILQPVKALVHLRGGLTVPLPALELALELERRGFRQTVDAEQQYQIEPADGLTAADQAAIARWRLHLAAIVSYEAPECA